MLLAGSRCGNTILAKCPGMGVAPRSGRAGTLRSSATNRRAAVDAAFASGQEFARVQAAEGDGRLLDAAHPVRRCASGGNGSGPKGRDLPDFFCSNPLRSGTGNDVLPVRRFNQLSGGTQPDVPSADAEDSIQLRRDIGLELSWGGVRAVAEAHVHHGVPAELYFRATGDDGRKNRPTKAVVA